MTHALLPWIVVAVAQIVSHCADAHGVETLITIRVKADENPKQSTPIEITKNQEVFGRCVDDKALKVDSMNRGIADVFVWTHQVDQTLSLTPTPRLLVLADGQYLPRTIIAHDRDRLDFRVLDSGVADMPNAPFANVEVTDQMKQCGTQSAFSLSQHFDAPVPVTSSIYPWMVSWIFVEKDTVCRTTNQFGECKVPITLRDALPKEIKISLWHPKLGKLAIESAPKSVRATQPGSIRVALAADARELEIDLVVSLEPRQ
jgi:hypothetical protein